MGLALFVFDDSVLFDMLRVLQSRNVFVLLAFLCCWIALYKYYDDDQSYWFTLCVPKVH